MLFRSVADEDVFAFMQIDVGHVPFVNGLERGGEFGEELVADMLLRTERMTGNEFASHGRRGDATVDFERKGAASGITTLWLEFGNVAVQTTGRLAKTAVASKAFRRTLYGIVGSAAAIEFANYMIGGEDTDGTPMIEKIPGYERIQNVNVQKGVLERIFGVSSIQIETAGSAGMPGNGAGYGFYA